MHKDDRFFAHSEQSNPNLCRVLIVSCSSNRLGGDEMAVNIKVQGNFENKGLRLDFDWDETTGEISGKDAESAKCYLKLFGGKRSAGVVPDWSIVCDLPYKSRSGMAAALHHMYELPDWLAKELPLMPDLNKGYNQGVVY